MLEKFICSYGSRHINISLQFHVIMAKMEVCTKCHGIPKEVVSLKDFKQAVHVGINTSLAAPWMSRNQENRGDALTQPRPEQLRRGGNAGAVETGRK